MKYYKVEFKRNYEDDFDNWIGDWVEADSEDEAEDLAKTWLVEHGEENVDDLYVQVNELPVDYLTDEQFLNVYDSSDIYTAEMNIELCYRAGMDDEYAESTAENVEDVICEACKVLRGRINGY